MIKSPADISARGKPDGNIRREFPIRTPVFMGHLNKLLHCRPEIVGKFGTLDDNTYLIIETAHSVCRSHNKIFGNGCVENPLFPKLLLHSFSNIKDSSLIFVGNILSPDIGVGIKPEFRFQCFIQSCNKFLFITFPFRYSVRIFS